MPVGPRDVASSYLAQLRDADLALLARANPELREAPDGPAVLRARPELIEGLLGQPASFEHVFSRLEASEPIALISPFLLFALCVHRTITELAAASYVTEWYGPRQRTPVFDVAELRAFLTDGSRRLFLVELLSSYTHVASGSVLVATRRGLRRQRFSELDPIRLAGLLDVVPAHDRAGIYRRLGDLSLFLTGVFPDHSATHGFSEIDTGRLLRAGRARQGAPVGTRPPSAPEAGVVSLLERLGPRWYRLAQESEPREGAREPVLSELAERFVVARRILNVVTDSFLFPWRSRFFGIGG